MCGQAFKGTEKFKLSSYGAEGAGVSTLATAHLRSTPTAPGASPFGDLPAMKKNLPLNLAKKRTRAALSRQSDRLGGPCDATLKSSQLQALPRVACCLDVPRPRLRTSSSLAPPPQQWCILDPSGKNPYAQAQTRRAVSSQSLEPR